MKKKILIVSSASYNSGGKAKFTQLLYDKLKKESKYKVYLINTLRSKFIRRSNPNCSSIGYKYVISNGFIRFIDVIINSFLFKIQFVSKLIKIKPDIVQIHTSSYFDFWDNSIFILIARFFRFKVIVRVGGGAFDKFYLNSSLFIKKIIRRIFLVVDQLIIQSKYWYDFFIQNNLRKHNIIIVPNFVDMNFWNNENYNTAKDVAKFKILFIVGNAEHRKGYHDLMPAFNELINNYHNLHLTLVALGRKLESKYKPLVKMGNLRIINHIQGDSKLKVFKESDVYILPTHSEGFPNTILEAMAAELPIITTNIPQIASFLENGENAILVTPGNKKEIKNAILQFYNDKQLRNRISINNTIKCKKDFDISKIVGYFKTIYD